MALDPQIGLQAGKGVVEYDPIGAISKAYTLKKLMTDVQFQPELLQQKLASEKASQAFTEANTSGQQILNEQAAKELATRKRLAEIARANSKVDKDGRITFDHLAIANMAAQEGLDPGTIFSYMDKASESAQKAIKTGADESKFAADTLSTANNMIRTQTDPKMALDMATSTVKILERVLGPEKAKQFAGQFWRVPDTPAENPQVAGQHFIDQSRVNAQATISPQQAIDNRALGKGDSQFKDDSSPLTKVHQAILVQNGVPEEEARKMTYGQIRNDPVMSSLLAQSVVPASERGAYRAAATGIETTAPTYRELSSQAQKLLDLGASDVPIINIIQKKFSQKGYSDADRDTLTYLVEVAKKEGLPIDGNTTPRSLLSIMRGQANMRGGQASIQKRESQRGLNVGIGGNPPTGLPPATFNFSDESPERIKAIRKELKVGVGSVTQEDLDAFDKKYAKQLGLETETPAKKFSPGQRVVHDGKILPVMTMDEVRAKLKKGEPFMGTDGIPRRAP